MRDPLLEEANRRAHKVSRMAAKERQAWRTVMQSHAGHDTVRPLYDAWTERTDELNAALDAYEEIERRQEREATA